MPKFFICDYPNCKKAFGRSCDLERHNRTHCEYEDREFGCTAAGCGFRANQRCGLKAHVDSMHNNIRLPCTLCANTYADASSLSKHRRRVHEVGAEGNPIRRQPHLSMLPNHDVVPRPVDKFEGLLTFSVHASPDMGSPPPDGPSTGRGTRRFVARGSTPGPSSFVYRPPERRGGFHPVTDVPSDCRSIDQYLQQEHQAYDANPIAAPTAWGYYANAPDLSSPQLAPQEPPIQHPPEPLPPNQGVREGTDLRTDHDQPCNSWNYVRGPLTLAPLRGRDQGMRTQPENEALSYPRVGHVPQSDQQWMHPPTDNHPSPVYIRTNPRILFDF